MADQESHDLAAIIRAKLLAGTLPSESAIRIWAGEADRETVCDACGNPIRVGMLEYEPEFPDGALVRFHQRCLAIWDAERVRVLQMPRRVSSTQEIPPRGRSAQARTLFIVTRDQPRFYAYIRREFADDPDVDVIIDRRVGERRVVSAGRAHDRRRSERRARTDVARQLATQGFAIVFPGETGTPSSG